LPHIGFAVTTDRTGLSSVPHAEYSKPQARIRRGNAQLPQQNVLPTQHTMGDIDLRVHPSPDPKAAELRQGKYVMIKIAIAPVLGRRTLLGSASIGYILP